MLAGIAILLVMLLLIAVALSWTGYGSENKSDDSSSFFSGDPTGTDHQENSHHHPDHCGHQHHGGHHIDPGHHDAGSYGDFGGGDGGHSPY
jgi:hypothetical protein